MTLLTRIRVSEGKFLPPPAPRPPVVQVDDDNKSALSALSESKRGGKAAGAKVDGLIDRKQLAIDNRMLAESAGQMLHTLIMEGEDHIKTLIISAIIRTVQQPGSTPPEDVRFCSHCCVKHSAPTSPTKSTQIPHS